MNNQKSIKNTLELIRKALEDEKPLSEKDKDDYLILNKLIKEDGTTEIIDDNSLKKNEIKEILNQNLTNYFDKHFDKWLKKNFPNYLNKKFNNN